MVDSPLESGPVVGTSDKENIAEGYQKLGNVVQEPVKPGVTGDMVEKVRMDQAQAITALANGISKGFSPLIDSIASNVKEQNDQSALQAGIAAGAAQGANVSGASTLPGADTLGAPSSGQPAGAQIARGSDGSSSVLPSFPTLGFGSGGENYARGVAFGAASITTTQVNQDLNAMNSKYDGDPEGFKGASSTYLGNMQLAGLRNGPQIKMNSIKTASEYYNGLVAKKASQDMIASGKALETNIDSVSNDMSALARGGQMNSPEFSQKQDQLQDLYGQLSQNPHYTGNADNKFNEKLNGFQSDNLIGRVDDAQHAGGASAAQKMLGDAIDKIPGLSDKEREDFLRQGEARIRYNQGINKDQVDINDARFKNLEAKIKAGDRSPDAYSGLEGVIASSKATGDHVTQVNATDLQTSIKALPSGLSPSEVRTQGPSPLTPMRGAPGNAGMVQKIRAGATVAGADPNMMERIYHGEGAGGYNGDIVNGVATSFGPFQLHMGGLAPSRPGMNAGGMGDDFKRETGLDPRNPSTVDSQIAWVSRKLAEDPSLIRNFHGYSPSNRISGATASGAPDRSTPFTDEQIRANPGLYTSYTDLVAGDMKVRKEAAENLGKTIEVATSNHELPPPETTARYFQMGQDIPAEQERMARVAGAVQTLAGNQGGVSGAGGSMPGGGGSYQQQVDALVAGKDDLFKMGVRASADKNLDEEAKFAKSHPVEYAVRKGWAQQPAPINFSDPNSVAQGFQATAQITAGVARREPGVSASAIPETLKPQAEAALVSADPQQAVNTLNAIAALPKDARDATIKDMSKAIIGATKSGDPVRMAAAYSLMDQENRENPMTLDDKFGEGALAALRKWQEIGQFQTTEKIAKDAMTADDPSTIKARDALKEYAKDKILNTVTGEDVVNLLAGTATKANPQSGFVNRYNPFGVDYKPMSDAPGIVLGALKYDYDQNYKEQYAKTADQPAAEKYALEKIGIKWGQSDANGGRFMAYPPERSQALPMVNGDKSWIGKQLGADVYAIHPDGKEAFLAPDAQTQAEMTSGRIPSYNVVTRGTDGALYGLPKRWAPDPARAQAEANAYFRTTNAAVQPRGGLPGVAGGALVAR